METGIMRIRAVTAEVLLAMLVVSWGGAGKARGDATTTYYSGYVNHTTIDHLTWWMAAPREWTPDVDQAVWVSAPPYAVLTGIEYAYSHEEQGRAEMAHLQIPTCLPWESHGELMDSETLVTAIRDGAFSNRVEIQTVEFVWRGGGWGMTNIGSAVFSNCTSLTSVSFEVRPYLTPWSPQFDPLSTPSRIGKQCFYGCSSLTNIDLPDSVTDLGEQVLAKCTALKTATLGMGTTRVPEGTFKDCSALESVTFRGDITEIGDYAFCECSSLTNIVIPDSVTNIGCNAFSGCTGLVSVAIGDGVTDWLFDFSDCPNLKSVVLGKGIKSIPPYAFQECTALATLKLPEGLESIGENAFYGCSALTNFVIPDSVTSIGDCAFYGCSALTKLVIPDSVTDTGYDAFSECTGLVSVEIGNGMTHLFFGDYFRDCTNLVSVTLGNGITSISGDQFTGCNSLERVLVRSGNPAYASLDGVVFTSDMGTLVFCPPGKRGVYTVPAGVERVEESAFRNSALETVYLPDGLTEIRPWTFQGCSNLVSVPFPAGLERIGSSAFSGCASLENVTIPAGVTNVADNTFNGCTRLSSVLLPEGLERIGYSAFADCASLETIAIPAGVTNIADGAFSGCTRLSSYVVEQGNAVYSSVDGVLFDAAGSTLLAYPAGRTNRVYTIPAWVVDIRPRAFSECRALVALEVAAGNGRYSSVDGGLYGKDGTELVCWPRSKASGNVVIPSGTRRICAEAFFGMADMVSVSLPEGLKRIEQGAFAWTGLETVTIPKSVRFIGGDAFYECPLQSATILGGAVSGAFVGCSSLKTLTLGTRVSAITYYAFAHYASKWVALETVHAPVGWKGKANPLSNGLFGFFGPDFTILYDNEVDDGEPTEEEEEFEDVWNFDVVDGEAVLGMYSAVGGKVVMPSTLGGCPVTAIREYAFWDGGDLITSLRIPGSVERIGAGAFSGCTGLTALYVPESWEGTGMLDGVWGWDGQPEGCTVYYYDARPASQRVVFDANGGTCKKTSVTAIIGGTYTTLATASWENHSFLGWFDAREGGNRVKIGMKVTAEAERTLYAHWQAKQQTVHFDANGGTSKKASVTCLVGGTYSGFPACTWENHVFQGWYDAPEGGTRVKNGMQVTTDAERTLYARWKRQTVRFDANGGTSKKESVTCFVGGTYSGFPACTWENHVFQGWYDAPEGGTRVKNGMQVTTDSERTLYARWKQQTVHFDANGGTCKKASMKCFVGGTYTSLASAGWDGRKFLGWFDARTGGNRIKIGMPVTEDAERTLYAHWEQTVRFDANGGTCKKASVTCVIGETYTTLATASWAGHTFQGWYDAPEGGTRVRIGMTVSTDPERTLYAHWKAKASGTGLHISGFTAGGTPRAEGSRRAAVPCAALTFEAEAGSVYELQWAPSPAGEWTTLRRWTAESDGEASVDVPASPGESTGFYRLAVPSASDE